MRPETNDIDFERIAEVLGQVKKLGDITEELRRYYRNSASYKKLHYSNQKYRAEDLFDSYMNQGVFLFISRHYRTPEHVDESFDVVKDIITKILTIDIGRGKEKVTRMDSWQIRVRNQLRKENVVSIYNNDGKISSEVEGIEGESMEEKILTSITQEDLEKANKVFLISCNHVEAIVLTGMLKNQPITYVQKCIASLKGVEWSTNKVNGLKNKLEFRLTLLYYIRGILSDYQLNKIFKKKSNLVKFYFGAETLTSIPPKELLEETALGKNKRDFIQEEKSEIDKYEEIKRRVLAWDPKAVEVKGNSNYIFKSKKDYKGETHKYEKTFINISGSMYCHSAPEGQKVKNIWSDEFKV